MVPADLPPALRTEQAAELLDCSPDTLWKLAREGTAPIEPLRLGRALRWPTAPLLALLGISTESPDALSADGGSAEGVPEHETPDARPNLEAVQ